MSQPKNFPDRVIESIARSFDDVNKLKILQEKYTEFTRSSTSFNSISDLKHHQIEFEKDVLSLLDTTEEPQNFFSRIIYKVLLYYYHRIANSRGAIGDKTWASEIMSKILKLKQEVEEKVEINKQKEEPSIFRLPKNLIRKLPEQVTFRPKENDMQSYNKKYEKIRFKYEYSEFLDRYDVINRVSILHKVLKDFEDNFLYNFYIDVKSQNDFLQQFYEALLSLYRKIVDLFPEYNDEHLLSSIVRRIEEFKRKIIEEEEEKEDKGTEHDEVDVPALWEVQEKEYSKSKSAVEDSQQTTTITPDLEKIYYDLDKELRNLKHLEKASDDYIRRFKEVNLKYSNWSKLIQNDEKWSICLNNVKYMIWGLNYDEINEELGKLKSLDDETSAEYNRRYEEVNSKYSTWSESVQNDENWSTCLDHVNQLISKLKPPDLTPVTHTKFDFPDKLPEKIDPNMVGIDYVAGDKKGSSQANGIYTNFRTSYNTLYFTILGGQIIKSEYINHIYNLQRDFEGIKGGILQEKYRNIYTKAFKDLIDLCRGRIGFLDRKHNRPSSIGDDEISRYKSVQDGYDAQVRAQKTAKALDDAAAHRAKGKHGGRFRRKTKSSKKRKTVSRSVNRRKTSRK